MEALIKDLYNPLFFFIKKRIDSLEDAEDLTQEVFLKFSKSNVEKVENLKSWLYAIAKNSITDFYRKKKILNTDEEEDVLEPEWVDDSAVEELSQCIVPFIKQLPDEYKELLTLSDIKQVPQKDIAEQLDMNYVTVRSKIQRGRTKLKELFTQCCSINQSSAGNIMDYQSDSGDCGPC